MKSFFRTLIFLLLATVSAQVSAKLKVVTTTQDLGYFAKTIGGDNVEVATILKGYQDPHFATAKPSYMVQLNRADLLIFVGLDLEIGWLPLVLQGARNPAIMPGNSGCLDASQFITPIEVPPAGADRSKGDLHPKGNPHYWLDPENAAKVAKGIAERLKQLDPEHASVYDTGLNRLLSEIQRAEEEVTALLAHTNRPPIVTYHVTFSYFFTRFGLASIGFIEPKPGIPPSPGYVAELVTRLKNLPQPPIILVEPYYDQDVPRKIAEQTGGRSVLVPSSIGGTEAAQTYHDLLMEIARAIMGK